MAASRVSVLPWQSALFLEINLSVPISGKGSEQLQQNAGLVGATSRICRLGFQILCRNRQTDLKTQAGSHAGYFEREQGFPDGSDGQGDAY